MFDGTRWNIFTDPAVWNFILEGVVATLQAAAIAAVGAIILGIVLSLLRSSRLAWVRIPTAVVIEFFRGMPVLLMMLFILLVASTGAFWAVVIALILYNGTLIGEILRAGLVGASARAARSRPERRHARVPVQDAGGVPAGVPPDAADHHRAAGGAC